MRVHINGRLPVIKKTTIDYPNGEEGIATLVYEKLERHCLKCGRLDHEIRDCLEAKHEKRALLAAQDKPRLKDPDSNSHDIGSRNFKEGSEARDQAIVRNSQAKNGSGTITTRVLYLDESKRAWIPKEKNAKESDSYYGELPSRRRELTYRDSHRTYRGDSHTESSPKQRSYRAKELRSPHAKDQRSHPRDSLIDHHIPPEQGIPWKVKETRCTQKCAEPSERAYKHVHQILLEASGGQAARVPCSPGLQNRHASLTPSTGERVPISDRLGPLNDESSPRTSVHSRLAEASGHETDIVVRVSSRLQEKRASLTPATGERVPILDRLGPLNDESSPRVPIQDRLGPVENEASLGVTIGETEKVRKRKPGRPPGKRCSGSPLLITGASSRKRKVQQTKNSNVRKKLHVETGKSDNAPKGTRRKGQSSRAGIPHDDTRRKCLQEICSMAQGVPVKFESHRKAQMM
ncbi:hypothetical protein Bca4012_085608 [Brassica carinata]